MDAEQQRRQEMKSHQHQGHSDCQPEANKQQRLSKDHPEQSGLGCTERYSNTEFGSFPRHGVRQNTIQTKARQPQRHCAKSGSEARDEPLSIQIAADLIVDSWYAINWQSTYDMEHCIA